MSVDKNTMWSSIVKTDKPVIIKDEPKKIEKPVQVKKEHTFETVYEMAVFDTLYSFKEHPLVECIDINEFISFFYSRLKRTICQDDLTNGDIYQENERDDIYQSMYSTSTTNANYGNYTLDDDYTNL